MINYLHVIVYLATSSPFFAFSLFSVNFIRTMVVIIILTFQPLIVCRYFIYGMQDSQNLERVVLAFDKFDIPYGRMDR